MSREPIKIHLSNIDPSEWHLFKFKCPNMRLLFNQQVSEIRELKAENKKLKEALSATLNTIGGHLSLEQDWILVIADEYGLIKEGE